MLLCDLLCQIQVEVHEMDVIQKSGGASLERAIWTCHHDHCYVLPPVSKAEEPLELKVEEIEDDGINWTENCPEVEEDETGKSDKELDGRTSDDEEFSKEMLYKYFENSEDTVSSEENNMDEDNLGIENERNPQQKCENSTFCKSTEERNSAQTSRKDYEIEGAISWDNLQPVECEMCEEIFQGQDQLEKHLVTHIGSISFQCSFCKRIFPTVKYLKNHKKRCKQQDCLGGNQSTANEEKFDSGDGLQKIEEFGPMNNMKCDKCERKFGNKSDYEDHISKQECVVQTFESPKDNLKSHSNIHEQKKIPCRICSLEFTPVKLIDHLLEHNTQLVDTISVQNKRFKKGNDISGDSLMDTTTYNCAFCNNSGFKKLHLKEHLKSHVKKLRTMHVLYPDKENNVSIQDEFACTICSGQFASETYTLIHMEEHCSKQGSSYPNQEKGDLNLDSTDEEKVTLRLKSYASSASKPTIHGYVVIRPSKLLQNNERDEQNEGEPMSFKPLMKAKRQYVLCAPMPGTAEAEYQCKSGGKNLLQQLYAVKTGDSNDPNGASVKYTDSLADSVSENTVTYKCNLCEEIFKWKSYLFSHILKHENYVCSCGEVFGLLTPLHKHVYHHRMKQSCQCEICGKTFRRMSQLKPHLKDHYDKERKYECETCGRTFVRPNELRKHRMRHNGEKPHVCDKCGTAFLDSHALKRHINTHTDNKPFQCKVCKKNFRVRDNLQVHMRIHTGEKPYKCPKCPQAFNHNVSLKNHQKRFHSEDA